MMTSAFVWQRDYNYYIRSRPVFQGLPLDPEVTFRRFKQPIVPKPHMSDLDLKHLDTQLSKLKEQEYQTVL